MFPDILLVRWCALLAVLVHNKRMNNRLASIPAAAVSPTRCCRLDETLMDLDCSADGGLGPSWTWMGMVGN